MFLALDSLPFSERDSIVSKYGIARNPENSIERDSYNGVRGIRQTQISLMASTDSQNIIGFEIPLAQPEDKHLI
jgi:hypothetical protein